MTHLIETLYILSALGAIAACIPQLRQILRVKTSTEFSLPSWLVWFLAQLATMAYVISIQNYLMIMVNLAWVSFYGAMVYLIIYYRKQKFAPTHVPPVDKPI